MTNKISFIPASEEVEKYVPAPVPAKLEVPEWYKRADTNYMKNPVFDEQGSVINNSIKQCVPFLDAMTAGYIQKTWCDIYVRPIDGNIEYSFATSPDPLGQRPKAHAKTFSEEFYPAEFFWRIPWQVKLPQGYSAFAIHPLNREDLPFHTMAGFIDADGYHHAPFGNMPFYIKRGFEGIIPSGTPMYQFIPVRRESWKSESEAFSDEETKKRFKEQRRKFWGFYKETFWHRKEYY